MSSQTKIEQDQGANRSDEANTARRRPAVTAELTDQVAVITGAAGGIGRAVTRLLSGRGARLVLVDLDAEKLDTARELLGELDVEPRLVVGDLTEPAVALAAARAGLDWGRIDILVNNAGMGSAQRVLWEVEIDDWRRDIEVNLTSAFLMCRAVLPAMIGAGYGRVVNMASMAGKEGTPLAGGYAAAKAGLIGMTKTLGKELAQTGVLANVITPSVIDTDILQASWYQKDVLDALLAKVPMGRMGTTDEVAELVGYLTSPRMSYSTGAVFDVSGGRATY
jgi:NAD(P)-dependent dehydrogenase (short-subunit alcohol dehydrogenase family)